MWQTVLHAIAYPLCLLIVLVLVVWADRAFPVLRDAPAPPASPGDPVPTHILRPYSLGRVQMAFWTILIVGSLAYLCIFGTHEFASILVDQGDQSADLAVLMGISGATGLLAAGVDFDKDKQVVAAQAAVAALQPAIQDMKTAAAGGLAAAANAPAPGQPDPALIAQLAAKTVELRQHQVTIRRLQRDNIRGTFISDLLTDENGNSLHRLQLLLFTLLFGAGFVISVAAKQSLMGFNANMLALMGISSGVYVGFKLPGSSA